MRDVAAGYDTLVNVFERIHFFLQRLISYAGVPLTEGLTELLGKIMAQLLSLLALLTKIMADSRISELDHLPCGFLAQHDSEKFMKMLVGRREVEDALLRLDSLTREEYLMVAARNLNVTHHVDRVIRDVRGELEVSRKLTEDIDDNIQATLALTKDVGHNINVIEGFARSVDDNVKASRRCTQLFLSPFTNVPTPLPSFVSLLSSNRVCQYSNERR